MADFTINRGDLYPPLATTLEKQDESTGEWEPLDLSDAVSVTLVMVSDRPSGTKITGACDVVSAPAGTIEYPWEAGDTEVAGQYRTQFAIVWSNSKPQTIPSSGYYIFEIQQNMAAD